MSSVSVIVATLDRPALLAQALESIRVQSTPPIEVIVVDDGSATPVDEAALRDRFGPTIRVLRNAHPQGLAWARQQGVDAAIGDYVAHLDDDDRYAPDYLAVTLRVLAANTGLDLVFVGTEGFGSGGAHFNEAVRSGMTKVLSGACSKRRDDGLCLLDQRLFGELLARVPMPFQRVVCRRQAWQTVHTLRLEAHAAAHRLTDKSAAWPMIRGTLRDSEWALYAALTFSQAAVIDRPLYLQRLEGQNTSSRPEMRLPHMHQMVAIKEVMHRAASAHPRLRPHRKMIRRDLSSVHFSTAYEHVQHGQLRAAWPHIARSVRLTPRIRQLRFLAALVAAALVGVITYS